MDSHSVAVMSTLFIQNISTAFLLGLFSLNDKLLKQEGSHQCALICITTAKPAVNVDMFT